VKRTKARAKGKNTRRKWNLFRWLLQPRNSLPCVALVVLGGCLTFIVMPDEPAQTPSASGSAAAASSSRKAVGLGGVKTSQIESSGWPTIVVDPGHGGRDEGTKWRGVCERDLTLDVALRMERLLTTVGLPVVLTRRENVYVSLEERTRIANNLQDALFVSVHFNSDATGSSSGIETYYARQKEPPETEWSWIGIFGPSLPPINDTSIDLAAAVQTAVTSRTEAGNRGVRMNNFYVVHRTRCPAILVEAGFLSNVFEEQLLINGTYRERLAEGIVEGVIGYLKAHPPTQGPLPPLQMVEKTG
jgi:N-acetylmuramoyl-L-alanine amidase